MAREEGVEEVVIGLTYSVSPVHTHGYYAERAAALADCAEMDRLYLKDPGGLLTRGRCGAGSALPDAAGDRPVELHSHCTIGLAPIVYMEGLRAGFRVLHTAVAPLARGTSNPAAETTLRDLEAEGFSHRLDLDALAAVSEHFRELGRRKGLPVGAPQEFDATYYHHQLAGGMVSTTRRMLEEQRRPELFDAVLEEVGRVRAEMGYPIIVTPVSQLVATQALRNVVDSERWSNVSVETIRYFLGHYGEPAAPVDPDVAERVLSRPRVEELRKLEPIHLEGARERFGRGDLRRGAAAAADHARGAGGRDVASPRATAATPPTRRTSRLPVVDALPEVREAKSIDSLRVQKGDERRGVAPCDLTTSRASCSTSTGRSCTGPATSVHVQPGAPEVLGEDPGLGPATRRSSRTAATTRRRVRRRAARRRPDVADDELLTPLRSVQATCVRTGPGSVVAVRDRARAQYLALRASSSSRRGRG